MYYAAIIGLIIICFVVIMRSSYNVVGTPSKNSEERFEIIKQKVELMGGEVINIEKGKSKDCPYSKEMNNDDGSTKIFYKTRYCIGDEVKEGWAILIIQQSIVLKTGSPEKKWVWRL